MAERWLVRPIGTWTDPVTANRRGAHLLGRKAAQGPLDVQLAALRRTYEQIPAEQQPTFLARLDEVDRAWTGQLTAEAAHGR